MQSATTSDKCIAPKENSCAKRPNPHSASWPSVSLVWCGLNWSGLRAHPSTHSTQWLSVSLIHSLQGCLFCICNLAFVRLFYLIFCIVLCSVSQGQFDCLCKSLHALVQFCVTNAPHNPRFVNSSPILKKHPLTPELDLLFLGINVIKSPVKSIPLTGPVCSVYIWIYKILIDGSKYLIISIWLCETPCL